METIYRAFDGTEFHDEDECLNYEREGELKDLKGCVLLDYDKNSTLIPDEVMYAYFRNEEQLLAFNKLCDEDGVPAIETYDKNYELAFFYNASTDEYMQYQERIDNHKARITTLENELEEIKNAIL